MSRFRILVAAVFAATALAAGSATVLAYGRADSPLAQIEVSANCNNPNSPFCAPSAFGTGGIWLWIEIDQDGTADVAGAECVHQPGGFSGAQSLRGNYSWAAFNGSIAGLEAAYPHTIVVGADPGSNYYVLPTLGFAFPQTVGHYSFTLDTHVGGQVQVAP